jgi:rubrerythrin
MFFCIVFQSLSAHTTAMNSAEKKNTQESSFSVNTEKLFFEAGKLLFYSEYNGVIPLDSINYSNGRCYTSLSQDFLADSYTQGYQCNKCHYILIKTSPGAPGKCPSCGSSDWTIM